MIPKTIGTMPPHITPTTIRMIALVWIELRSGAGGGARCPVGGKLIGVLSGRWGQSASGRSWASRRNCSDFESTRIPSTRPQIPLTQLSMPQLSTVMQTWMMPMVV